MLQTLHGTRPDGKLWSRRIEWLSDGALVRSAWVLRHAGSAAALLLACLAPSQAQDEVPVKQPCAGSDKACASQALRTHPLRTIAAWGEALRQPVRTRVGPAAAALVEFLTLDNIQHGYPERPRSARPDAAFMADVQGAMAELPPAVWRVLGEQLLGVYLVDDLGGTGFSDYVVDASGKAVGAYVVLDAAVLGARTANAWASWKESSPFQPSHRYQLQARIADAPQDNRRNAIQYILLHELGHVVAAMRGGIHPPWTLAPRAVEDTSAYPFFNLSWRVDRSANAYRSLFDGAFPQRRQVVYYFGARLQARDMVEVYTQLSRTNFPSLYAATQPGDDFAESFASYVHTVLLQRPWQVTLLRDGEVVKTYGACWSDPRCAQKRSILEALLR